MIKIYGLKNCSTCVKAQKWLEAQSLSFEFIDYRADRIAPELILQWSRLIGWDKLINKSSTSWRTLSDEQKQAHTDHQFLALLADSPSLMKRPVAVHGAQILLGFKPEQYQDFFKGSSC